MASSRQARFERRLAARQEERRVEDRRIMAMTPSEVDDWLKQNGISGTDRRKAQRRMR